MWKSVEAGKGFCLGSICFDLESVKRNECGLEMNLKERRGKN